MKLTICYERYRNFLNPSVCQPSPSPSSLPPPPTRSLEDPEDLLDQLDQEGITPMLNLVEFTSIARMEWDLNWIERGIRIGIRMTGRRRKSWRGGSIEYFMDALNRDYF
jgi:hypothetical protein